TPGDLDAIMAIETPTFGTDAWSPDTMSSELASEHTVYLVATESEAAASETAQVVVGYVGLLAPLHNGDADIQTIAVAPSVRRRGLGRMLMVAVLRHAVDRGDPNVFLEVRADNPNAQALYVSLGFEQIAVRPHYYQPDDVSAHIMRLTIPEGSRS
ncbi:MAG: [ribosomal protein S18]-alanine N-acetyltransferase, partial [Actinomycetota bacterium]|nr:[ribosomal protein S18]-alanine N-acetyltransferase [Actinomycetota bacterium]